MMQILNHSRRKWLSDVVKIMIGKPKIGNLTNKDNGTELYPFLESKKIGDFVVRWHHMKTTYFQILHTVWYTSGERLKENI